MSNFCKTRGSRRILLALVTLSVSAFTAHARDTMMKNERTGERLVVHTDEKGTTIRHSDRTSGTTSGGNRHDDYVDDYRRGGYNKQWDRP